jgi:hypothetical protein
MQVHAPMHAGILRPFGLRIVVECPVAGLIVVHTATGQLRQHVDHRAAGCGDEQRPRDQFVLGQLAALPYRAWRIDDEMAAVETTHEYQLRHDDAAALALKERSNLTSTSGRSVRTAAIPGPHPSSMRPRSRAPNLAKNGADL